MTCACCSARSGRWGGGDSGHGAENEGTMAAERVKVRILLSLRADEGKW